MFLKEKNQIDSLFRLRRALPQPVRGTFEVEELRNVMYSTEPLEQQAILKETTEPEPEPELPEEPVLPLPQQPRSGEEQIISDLYKQVMEDNEPEPENEPAEEDENVPEDTEDELPVEPSASDELPEIEELDEVPADVELTADELTVNIPEDDDLLKMYDEELKEFEINSNVTASDSNEIDFNLADKEKAESLYDFDEPSEETGKEDEDDNKEEEPGLSTLSSELAEADEFISDSEDKDYDSGLTDESLDDVINESFRKLEIPDEDIEFEFVPEDNIPDEIDNTGRPVIIEEPFPEPETPHEEDVQPEDETEPEKEQEVEESLNLEDHVIPEEEDEPAPRIERKKDLFKYLTNKEINKITDNIFNEDSEDFTSTIERISESSSYDDATEILKEVFLTNKVNPYSRDAVTFTNAVSNYFNQV
jgi:hypothetical protein